MIFPHLADKHH